MFENDSFLYKFSGEKSICMKRTLELESGPKTFKDFKS